MALRRAGLRPGSADGAGAIGGLAPAPVAPGPDPLTGPPVAQGAAPHRLPMPRLPLGEPAPGILGPRGGTAPDYGAAPPQRMARPPQGERTPFEARCEFPLGTQDPPS